MNQIFERVAAVNDVLDNLKDFVTKERKNWRMEDKSVD